MGPKFIMPNETVLIIAQGHDHVSICRKRIREKNQSEFGIQFCIDFRKENHEKSPQSPLSCYYLEF